MQRALRTNLVLLAVTALLGLAVYWQVGKETASFERPLSDLDPTLVRRVAASCAGCATRRFERRDGHWWMLEPYALPADNAMVQRLIGIAASAVRLRRPAQELDPAKIGLDPPIMRLELDDQVFDFGMTDALLGDRYVRTGAVIAMVPDRFSPHLMAAAESELDRHLVPRNSFVKSVSIDGVEMLDMADAWSKLVATRIRVADAIPQVQHSTRVELILNDGSALNYVVDRSNETLVAWRTPADAEEALADPPFSFPVSREASNASVAVGYVLDPTQLPGLLGHDIDRAN